MCLIPGWKYTGNIHLVSLEHARHTAQLTPHTTKTKCQRVYFLFLWGPSVDPVFLFRYVITYKQITHTPHYPGLHPRLGSNEEQVSCGWRWCNTRVFLTIAGIETLPANQQAESARLTNKRPRLYRPPTPTSLVTCIVTRPPRHVRIPLLCAVSGVWSVANVRLLTLNSGFLFCYMGTSSALYRFLSSLLMIFRAFLVFRKLKLTGMPIWSMVGPSQ